MYLPASQIRVWNPPLFFVKHVQFSFGRTSWVVLSAVGHLALETNSSLNLLDYLALETNNNVDELVSRSWTKVRLGAAVIGNVSLVFLDFTHIFFNIKRSCIYK